MRVARLTSASVVIASVVVLFASSASASSGDGSQSGASGPQTNTMVTGHSGCFESVGSYLSTSGSTSTSISDGTNTYSGDVSASWDYDFYQISDGTVTDSSCGTLGTGASGTASNGSLSGTNGSQTLSCSWTDGTYYRSGVTASSLTIDFPSGQGGCRVDGDSQVAMDFNNAGGFVQDSNGNPECDGSSTHPPVNGCNESFTFTLS